MTETEASIEVSSRGCVAAFLPAVETSKSAAWSTVSPQHVEIVMDRKNTTSPASTADETHRPGPNGIVAVHGVRYQVKDVARAVAFYTKHLGFKLEHQQLPAFASVSLAPFTLLLSGPEASGSRPLPGGRTQEPGGSNRVVLHVADLPARIEALKEAGIGFRNSIEKGPAGSQVQIEDPDGNPIELFEPAPR
jgi:glyoxylase I family protein